MRGLLMLVVATATLFLVAASNESKACDYGGGTPTFSLVQPQVAFVQQPVQYQVQQFAVQKQFVPVVQKQVVKQRVVRQKVVAPVVQQTVVKQRVLRSRSRVTVGY